MLSLLFLFLSISAVLSEYHPPPIVKIPKLGLVEGQSQKSLRGKNFFAFEGIPYAKPPVGKRRFEEPEEPKPWKGVWPAKTIHKCLQYSHFELLKGTDKVIGEEDCLYVNIYTPTIDQNAKLDVVIYIHGGAFMFLWGGFYGPRYAMDRNIVFINLNYRLGPLGFLSTASKVVPGNNGIRDQIFALKFIKNNVEFFGGNPESITIMGMSAGGASVHTHFLSPKSKNLFHRGISQSGTTLNPWVFMEKPLEKTETLAANLGCPTTNQKEMISCLKKRSGRQITQLVEAFQPWLYNPFSPFGLVVDSWSDDPVFPDHPYNLIINGKAQALPWIVSETNAEGLYPAADFLINKSYLDYIEENWNQLLPHILDYNYTVAVDKQNDVSQKIREEYLSNETLVRKNFPSFVQSISDRLFINGIHQTVQLQASTVKSPIYFYYYTYRGAKNWYQDLTGYQEDLGAAHAEDSAYFLSTPIDTASTDEDRKMIDFFLDLITDFAKTGVAKVPIDSKVEWKPVERSNKFLEGLTIDSPTKVHFGKIENKHQTFWEKLPIMENEKLINKIKDEL